MPKPEINILLVEDNPGDARLIVEMLRDCREIEYTVSVTEKISSAVSILKENKFDIIILDLNLPDSSGLATLDIISKNIADIFPIIVLTGLDDEDTGISAIERGAEDYLVKNEVNQIQMKRSIRYAIQRKKAEIDLIESERKLKEAQAVAKVGNWEYDIAAKKLLWSDQVYRMYERDPAMGAPGLSEEAGYYTRDDAAYLQKIAKRVIDNGVNADYDFNVVLDSGKRVVVAGSMRPVMDSSGKVIKIFGTLQDITERNKILEDLITSLNEKKELIREIYHRTKNNMQVIISLFSLQSLLAGDEKLERILKDMESRIRAMSLAHEKLYQSKNLSKIDMKDYLTELVNNILYGYGITGNKILITDRIESMMILIDTAIPCGLVVNELVSNTARYAFPGDEKGELLIRLSIDRTGEIELVVSDDGAGKALVADIDNLKTMGLQIVRNIVEYQLKGTIEFDNSAGVKWTIRFKDNIYEERI